jgi:hypothetical protein
MTNNIAFTQILYCGVDFSVLGVLFHTESLFAAIHRELYIQKILVYNKI